MSPVRAYYNEIDRNAAAWLRELIKQGLIANGDVDERSILDVNPADLAGYNQCHFFAGIGVWSYALRRAGWSDDRAVWTGSCPCQPFSAAGKGGGFTDERHLWPALYHLISECRPDTVFGEQVASKDGLAWLDLVHTDMEAALYAFAATDMCAAGVGAPHIRQRLYFVAHTEAERINRVDGKLEDPIIKERSEYDGGGGGVSQLGDDDDAGLEGLGLGYQAEGGRVGEVRSATPPGELGGLEPPNGGGRVWREATTPRHDFDGQAPAGAQGQHGPGITGSHRDSDTALRPTNGYWRDADWIACRDGKWRGVEPGTFPLAHGSPARVGRLRGYGNAIVAEVAKEFIQAYLNREGIANQHNQG